MAKKRPNKGDPGSDTNADSKMVDARETDPGFFKDPLIGKRVGKCVVEKLIGEGRTSVVYRALYEPLKRTVALKVLQPEMRSYPAVVRVFRQEGRAVAALDHENVLKIYDVGQDGETDYLVLELLRGKDLLDRIEKAPDGRMDAETALEMTAQAARGLAAAHQKNLVHRDIKPQNLVVEPGGKLKIVDFGLAAEAEGAFSGGRLGTPHYMAPEQCRGEQARTASDVYALGVTLFHMLVGHPPHAGAKTTDEIIERHLAGERFEPEKLVPGLPRKVADLVRRMTRMDPAGRPEAKEVYDLIRGGLLDGAGGRGGTRGRVRGRARRRAASRRSSSSGAPVALIVGGLVLAGLLAFLLGRDGDESTATAPPDDGAKDTVARGIGEPETNGPETNEPEAGDGEALPPDELLAEGLDPRLAEDLAALLADARREESTGNLREALELYDRVRKKAPDGSQYKKLGESAYKAVSKRIRAVDRGSTRKTGYVSAAASRAAGEAFLEERPELFRKAVNWRFDEAIARAEALRDKTREDTPERLRIEAALTRLSYVKRLLSIVGARVQSLSGPEAKWSRYDMMASGSLVVDAVGPEGIVLRDVNTDKTKTVSWTDLPLGVKLLLLDAVRNQESATETMWLGYYCQLHGDARSDDYYEYARMLDDGPAMRREIRALQESETPSLADDGGDGGGN